jgi:leucyl/phenylalanyl-tRNA--protein transferase
MRHTAAMSRRSFEITPDLLLRAYRAGLFPMAETRDGQKLHWLDPERRGILPLDSFHLPRRLQRTVLSGPYRVVSDTAFAAVIALCAEATPGRDDTWINGDIERMFNALHRMGHAHSVETFESGVLVGGLYGVAIGGVFFGESMFTRARDASKAALVHLVARLRLGGFQLLDTQFLTSHLAQFGAIEVPREVYKARLAEALLADARWRPEPEPAAVAAEIAELGRLSRH